MRQLGSRTSCSELIKAQYRSWAIPCAGSSVYAPRYRSEGLDKLVEPGVRVRGERLHQQLDGLQPLYLEAPRALLLARFAVEARRTGAQPWLRPATPEPTCSGSRFITTG